MVFNDTDHYQLNASDQWRSLIPQGHGWVHLGPTKRPFAVSMYHQFHCLISIRAIIFNAKEKPDSVAAAAASSHTNHCFSYIRQLLMCGADATLEPTVIVDLPNGKQGAAASGNDVVHQCSDWVQVRDYVEQDFREWQISLES